MERSWNARTTSGITTVGIGESQHHFCQGVVVRVDAEQVANFDVREKSYDRVKIPLQQVEQVPFLSKTHLDEYDVLFDPLEADASVWTYIPKNPLYSDRDYPICQSYIDIILRGCLTISEEFAASFIETTTGWTEGFWVDDREHPLYRNADQEYSQQMAGHLDQILCNLQPLAFAKRVKYDGKGELRNL